MRQTRVTLTAALVVGVLLLLPPWRGSVLAALNDGLLACYRFDNAALTTDSQGSHTLTNNGGATDTAGQINGAADVNGAGVYFAVADHADWNFSTDFTVGGWVYFDDFTASHGVISQSHFGTDGGWVIQVTSDPIVQFYIQTSAGDVSNVCSSGIGAVAATTWYQLVAVYDGNGAGNSDRCKIYLNNAEVTGSWAGTIPATLLNPTTALTLGRWEGLRNYDGRLDNWSIWNRPLTASEITTDLWNGGAGTACPLVAANPKPCTRSMMGFGC